MAGLINWELLAEMIQPIMPANPGVWDNFATKYDGYAGLEENFTRLQLEKIAFDVNDSLLDVGAGPGRISIPASRYVKSVTALDSSTPMLDCLQENAREAGIDNVSCINLAWEDVVPGENVPSHDIVIASRTPAMTDLKKLDMLARKYVYILFFAGPSLKNFHDELMAGIDPDPRPLPPRRGPFLPHMLMFNRLCDMGILPSVEYVRDGFTRWYESRDDAYGDFAWLEVPKEKEMLFRKNLDRFISLEESGYRLLWETRTVIIWWSK